MKSLSSLVSAGACAAFLAGVLLSGTPARAEGDKKAKAETGHKMTKMVKKHKPAAHAKKAAHKAKAHTAMSKMSKPKAATGETEKK